MNAAWIMISLTMGAVLGTFYFGGLWITVRGVTISQRPALLLFLSFLLRAGIVLVGFHFVMNQRWERLVASLIGFVLVRAIFIFRLRDVDRKFELSTIPVSARRVAS